MSDFVTAAEAAALRQARNIVRHHARRLAAQPDKAEIIQARYEQAVTLLAAHRLSGRKVNRDSVSETRVLPVNTD